MKKRSQIIAWGPKTRRHHKISSQAQVRPPTRARATTFFFAGAVAQKVGSWWVCAWNRLHSYFSSGWYTKLCEILAQAFSQSFRKHLVCDHERCLRTEEALLALKVANLKLVDFPKCSQDFNAIENVWAILKARLAETQPTALEHRDEFVKRLESAVRWANKHRADQLWHLSTNQVERADACLAQKPPGGRTKW